MGLKEGVISFRPETTALRKRDWKVAPPPESLLERRVELIGGASRQDLVTGLNTGARSYIADLWDLCAGDGWSVWRAHRNLGRAARLDLAYLPTDGGRIRINPSSTVRLMVSPRPMAVEETTHARGAEAVSATCFDLALLMTDCAPALVERLGGMYLYVRDVRSQEEARWWAGLFHALEERFSLPTGTIRATVMVDSVPGALQAEEILFELAQHSAGLSFDPQAYAADHIALFHDRGHAVMPDRESIGLQCSFLRSLSLHLIGVCHRRGCHAIGAPSFVLPPLEPDRVKADYLAMLADKEREAVDGHDGTLVVHPDTVNAAVMEFNKSMPRSHQLEFQRTDTISAGDLVLPPTGEITVESLVGMIRMALRALVQHRTGKGRVIQGGRLHDRSSLRLALRILWQWLHSEKGVVTATGLEIHAELIGYLVRKESGKLFVQEPPEIQAYAGDAADRLLALIMGDEVPVEPL